MSLKNEENSVSVSTSSQREEDLQRKYEPTIQKLEEETRDHIRIEQQFRLHIDCLQDRIEKLEASEKQLKHDLKARMDACNQLKEKLKESNEKYNELRQRMKKHASPIDGGAGKQHTRSNISIDEKPNKTCSEYSHVRKPSEILLTVVSVAPLEGLGGEDQRRL